MNIYASKSISLSRGRQELSSVSFWTQFVHCNESSRPKRLEASKSTFSSGWPHLAYVELTPAPVDELPDKTSHDTALGVSLKVMYFSMRKCEQGVSRTLQKIIYKFSCK
jgi:hypothetical protein